MLSLITKNPALEPVTVSEVKSDLRLESGEDLLLATLITSARLVVEAQTGCRLINQDWDLMFHDWPKNNEGLSLPHYPVAAISGVYVLGQRRQKIDENLYEAEIGVRHPAIFFKETHNLPCPKRNKLGLLISLNAGFGEQAEDVPAPLRLAIRQLVAFWYELGEWHSMNAPAKVPETVNTLLQPYRNIKL